MPAYEDLLRKLYDKCGKEGDLVQLMILMRQLAKEYFSEDLTDEEAKALIARICKAVVAQLASCGKQYTPEQCEKDFYATLLMSPPDNVFLRISKGLLKKKRTSQPTGAPLL